MNVGKWEFIPTEQIVWFENEREDRNLNADGDDLYAVRKIRDFCCTSFIYKDILEILT